MGTPNQELLKFFAKTFNVKTFVETGSGHGETAVLALKFFPFVHTIELDSLLHRETWARLGKQAKCYMGKSVDVLKDILPEIGDIPVVYWLDAHYSGVPTAGVDEQCPLLDELETINRRQGNLDFIIIDDAYTYFSPAVVKPPLDPRQFPNLLEIYEALNYKSRYTVILSSVRYVESHKAVVFPDNAIVSVPDYAKESLYNWLLQLKLEGM